MSEKQQHPYVEQELVARNKLEETRQQRDAARKQARDLEAPWSRNTEARKRAEASLTSATALTPLQDIIQWQSIVAAALFLDGRFRAKFEQLLQAQNEAEDAFKKARLAYEGVQQQIAIHRNERSNQQRAQMEAEIEAEVRATRTRKRAELMKVAA